jgi:hypothetical protein
MQIHVATLDLAAAKSRDSMHGVEFCNTSAVASIIFYAANLAHILIQLIPLLPCLLIRAYLSSLLALSASWL